MNGLHKIIDMTLASRNGSRDYTIYYDGDTSVSFSRKVADRYTDSRQGLLDGMRDILADIYKGSGRGEGVGLEQDVMKIYKRFSMSENVCSVTIDKSGDLKFSFRFKQFGL